MIGKQIYDGTLQMFVEQPRSIDLSKLRFLRWLAEHDRLEHPVAGPSRAAIGNDSHERDGNSPPVA
jgi:hypothetical protein